MDEIKLKHSQYENYGDLQDYMRIAAEDIALIKVLKFFNPNFKKISTKIHSMANVEVVH